jgi:hypothetical protein
MENQKLGSFAHVHTADYWHNHVMSMCVHTFMDTQVKSAGV